MEVGQEGRPVFGQTKHTPLDHGALHVIILLASAVLCLNITMLGVGGGSERHILTRRLSEWTNLHNNVFLQDFDSKHLPRGTMLGKQDLSVSMALVPNHLQNKQLLCARKHTALTSECRQGISESKRKRESVSIVC